MQLSPWRCSGSGRCHQSHLRTWCQAGGDRQVEVRTDSTAVSSPAPESHPASPPDKAAAVHCLGTREERIVLKLESEFVWQQQGTLTPAAKTHSYGAATGSVPSQVDSATELFLRKVLLSSRSNHWLYFLCWTMKPTAKWKCFRKAYLVLKNIYQKCFKSFFLSQLE